MTFVTGKINIIMLLRGSFHPGAKKTTRRETLLEKSHQNALKKNVKFMIVLVKNMFISWLFKENLVLALYESFYSRKI